MNRRKFLINAFSLVAAPAVVQASSLMPIKVIPFEPYMLLRGPTAYSSEVEEVRIYERADDPSSFISNDFFRRYTEAAGRFMYQLGRVGRALAREDGKAVRMVEVERAQAWQPIKKHSKPFDGRDWRTGQLIGFEVSPKRG